MPEITIAPIDTADLTASLEALADILQATVNAGAAVSFLQPFAVDEAATFWREKVFPLVRADGCVLFGGWVDGALAGTVQMHHDMPPNQPHRVEVSKMMVHPRFRRHGLGRALMAALEDRAAAIGKTLITLDTRTGSDAEPLYRGMGFQVTGEVPHFAMNPERDGFHATLYMHKLL